MRKELYPKSDKDSIAVSNTGNFPALFILNLYCATNILFIKNPFPGMTIIGAFQRSLKRLLRKRKNMGWLSAVEWDNILVPDTPLLEIIVRGSLVYLSLFALLRLVLKRQAGTVSMTDLLVIVLIADAAQNAMAADYKSVPDGILLVATLIFWNFLLEWLGYRFPVIEKWIHPPALLLIRNGKILHANMKRELITQVEIMSQLREQGIEDVSQVKAARLEGDGKLSVVQYEENQKKPDGAVL